MKKGIRIFPETIQRQNILMLRYFEPKFNLRWCHDGDLLELQIPVTQEGLNCERLAYDLVT